MNTCHVPLDVSKHSTRTLRMFNDAEIVLNLFYRDARCVLVDANA